MAGHPSAGELVAAVRAFIAGLALDGRDGFHAKVAANVLAIVERELAGQTEIAAALAPLAAYCRPGAGRDDHTGCVAANLSAAIRAGTLTVATPGLIDALIVATVARLRVDSPRYSTLARLEFPADVAPQR